MDKLGDEFGEYDENTSLEPEIDWWFGGEEPNYW